MEKGREGEQRPQGTPALPFVRPGEQQGEGSILWDEKGLDGSAGWDRMTMVLEHSDCPSLRCEIRVAMVVEGTANEGPSKFPNHAQPGTRPVYRPQHSGSIFLFTPIHLEPLTS